MRVIDGDGRIASVAGTGMPGALGEDGPATAGQLRGPWRVVPDRNGDLYVSDRYSHRVLQLVRQVEPRPRILSGPLNAASLEPAVAPGSLAVIDGGDLASRGEQAGDPPWPTTLGGASVSVNGVAAPLSWAAANRLALQIPFETVPGPATLEVLRGSLTASVQFTVSAAAPGIVTEEGGRALAENEDGSRNGPDNPAGAGTTLVLRFTGLGATDNPVATRSASPQEPLARPALPSGVRLGGQDCDIVYLGMMPGEVGMARAYVKVPALADGNYEVVITVGDAASKPAIVSVRAAAP